MEGSADFFDLGPVTVNGFVEPVAGDPEFFGPVGDVGGHLRVDLLWVVRAFGMFFVEDMRFMSFGGVVVLGHIVVPLSVFSLMSNGCPGIYA
jgi:hypothetical protein